MTLGGALAVSVVVIALAATGSAAAVVPAPSPGATMVAPAGGDWTWPFAAFHLERRYEAPATRFGPGHRGIDLRPLDGFEVRAPAAGVVAFSGSVAGRGILTIDHGNGLVTTLEPVDSTLTAGERVEQGEPVGILSVGGHAPSGALHVGVRLNGEYINPLLLLGGVPRAVLLPCC
jgi:murein DD-endopeptidase MepM/ murein hydrolase activator NlpD